jgi:hypothetical protein
MKQENLMISPLRFLPASSVNSNFREENTLKK